MNEENPEYDEHKMPPAFARWWANHRHAGKSTKDGVTFWSIPPSAAWVTDRYRAEFSSDTGEPIKLKQRYSAAELEAWANDARINNIYNTRFKETHDGRETPTPEEFESGLELCQRWFRKKNAPDLAAELAANPEGYAKDTRQEWLLTLLQNPPT